MKFLDKIFRRKKTEPKVEKKYITGEELEQYNKDFMVRFEKVKNLFASSLELYNSDGCPCAYPRYQQIIGIDCRDSGDSFKCYETDLLIGMSKKYFTVEKSELNDENTNEKWTCKKCGSTYEYGWSDFSISVDREKVKLVQLKANSKGKPVIVPIPLYLGLMGHSYPPQTAMAPVDFETFEMYMTEK
jgi:hypothetical protein